MRLDPTTAAGIDSPMGAALALLAERDASRDVERPLLDLSQAAPPYPPAPEVVERVVEVATAPDGAAYTPVPGIPPLRGAIADELSRDYAGTVEPPDVVVTAGCNQAFSLVADALAGPGDEVIMPLPYYFNHDMWLRMRGVAPVYLEPDAHLVPRAADAESLVTPRTRAIVLITPGNPSGVTIPPAEIAAFAALARRHDVALILDETYRSFRDTREPAHALFADPAWRSTAGQPALLLEGPRHPRLPGRLRRRRARAEPRGAQADGLRGDLLAADRAGGRARRPDPGRGMAEGAGRRDRAAPDVAGRGPGHPPGRVRGRLVRRLLRLGPAPVHRPADRPTSCGTSWSTTTRSSSPARRSCPTTAGCCGSAPGGSTRPLPPRSPRG